MNIGSVGSQNNVYQVSQKFSTPAGEEKVATPKDALVKGEDTSDLNKMADLAKQKKSLGDYGSVFESMFKGIFGGVIGLGGGAVAGAGIGASMGGPVGAVLGAIGGGLVGGFAGLAIGANL